MFEQLLRGVIRQRYLVMLAVMAMALLGFYNFQKLAIDAVPDITNVQVQINTAAPGYAPLETEQRISYPIETVMAGLPGLEQTRSISRYGLSQVTVIFKDSTDLYFARQLVNERLLEARDKLPAGLSPALGPISTGLGEIYMWTVEANADARKADGSRYNATDLREIQDWIIKPQLRTVAGVTEVNSQGGEVKEFLIAPKPDKLAALGISLAEVVSAVERNNANASAGYIEKRGEQYLIRAPGQLQSLADIAAVVVRNQAGVAIRVADLADVSLGRELRSGAATANGKEAVLGTVFMLIGQNSRAVSQAVDKKLAEINRNLPQGVRAITVYDRTVLVDKAINTVKKNLAEGAILVIVILFIFLGNFRAALITAMVIPLAMLFTFTGMVSFKVSANLMSLGALDFGIIVDGAVVIVENCVRRLALAQQAQTERLSLPQRLQIVFEAAQESRRPLLFGQAIIMVVYLPIFALSGVEGKMFHPMAFTVLAALAAAMLLSISFVPAAIALFIGQQVHETESRWLHVLQQRYQLVLSWAQSQRRALFGAAIIFTLVCLALASRLGSEFAPNLNEGDFALQALRIPGTSLSQSLAMQQQLERSLLARFPEIERVFARTGTAEVASDPMPPNISDGYIMLKPESAWPAPKKTRSELLTAIEQHVQQIPGNNYEFSQPIQLRFNELLSGVRSDVAVKLFGDELSTLNQSAQEIAEILQKIPGASEVKVEQSSGLPVLTIQIKRQKAAQYGLNIAEIQDAISIAMGGRDAGQLYQGDRRFAIVVRLPEALRNQLEQLQRLPLALPASEGAPRHFIPLAEVAEFDLSPGPNQLSRENGKRRIVISSNVRGRDIGSFVAEAETALAKLKLPEGYWYNFGGSFENLQSASQRLQIVIPAALVLVLALLYLMFGNLKEGLLVFSGIPFALSGGILALYLRDIPLSISAAVGFIALSGVAVLNGLVMLSSIRQLREQGQPLAFAVEQGALSRLRPVLMTALVASLGFIPMAIATGTGAEVQRPLASVVIGGILSSSLLTLLLLPLLYQWLFGREEAAQTTAPAVKPESAAPINPL